MTHAVKLMFFFMISVALHGAGLWAAAGRYEAREPEAPAGVAIVDRDLFFRHAERIESRASNPVSASDRITPRSASTVQPSQPGESIARAPAAAAGEAEPERRVPVSPAAGAMARLDLSIVEPAPPRREAIAPDGIHADRREPERQAPVPSAATVAPAEPERRAPADPAAGTMARLEPSIVEPAPPPRREAGAPDSIEAERREPVRMSGIEATAPPAATRRREAQLSVPAPVPARTSEALEPAGAARQASLVIAPPLRPTRDVRPAVQGPGPEPADVADSRRVRHQQEADAQLYARAAEPVARSAADAAVHGTVETIDRTLPDSLQAHAPAPAASAYVERSDAETARALSAAEAPRLAPPGTRAPADVAAREELAPADAAVASTAVPAQAPRDRLALRGTLPAPLLAARQSGEALRLRPSLPDETAPGRATVSAVPAEARSAEPMPAEPRAPPPPPATGASAPDPAPVSRAAPQQLAALAPEAPARRLESSEPPSGRDDPVDRFTRAYQGGECFFPLRLASRDGAAIRGYGLRAESVDMFRQAFSQALGTEPEVDWRPLTDAQCGGISFTRLVLGDSPPSVGIALERKELDVGQDLAGRVTGSRLEFVTLLVVDDSGVVHNVLDHLTPEAADLAFEIPVQPVDDGTDKVQLLMAVGASRPLPILASTTPVHSDDFFPALRDQAVDAGAVLELGLEDFVIRASR